MSERFADGAARLAGLAPRLLGWRPAEFWAATPAELAAILTTEASPSATINRAELNQLMERESDG